MSGQITGVDVTAVYTSLQASMGAKLGNSTRLPDGRIFEFVVAGGTINFGDYVFITSDGTNVATQATTTNIASGKLAKVGSYQNATAVTSGQYFWALRQGAHTGNYKTLFVVGSKAYVTSTGGYLDDTATTLIMGVTGLSTVGGADASINAMAYQEMFASGQ